VRVLFATSPVGLGHASRDIALAGAISKEWGADVTFASGGPAVRFITDHGYQALDLLRPPDFRVCNGRVVNWSTFLLRYGAYLGRSRRALRPLMRRPWELLIADEEFTSGPLAEERGIPWALMTDFLEMPIRGPLASTLAHFMVRGLGRALASAPLVLIPSEGVDAGNRRFVGPLVRPFSADRGSLRSDLALNGRTLLVTGGGTRHGGFLLRQAASLFSRGELVAEEVVMVGPLEDAPPGIRHLGYVPNLHDYILASDAVLTLAGRSTLDEAEAAGTPVVALPLANHFEQEMNAARLGRPPPSLDELPSAVEEAIARPRNPLKPPEHGRAVTALGELSRQG
jgi:UDP-N-acetylglucosamine--N-acetylmuramyl-(pentapeptide) pyrophosphoryl-undecaprenol N-acetylglucosamine transferase